MTSPRKFGQPRRGQLLSTGIRAQLSSEGAHLQPQSTLLKGYTGPLDLSLMQYFTSNTDLKIVRQESKLEMDEQIAVGLFRVYVLA